MSTKTSVENSIDTNLPTQGLGGISATDLRGEMKAVLNFANELTLNAQSGNYTVTSDDQVIPVDDSAGDVTLTLPAASTMVEMVVRVKKTEASGFSTIIQADGTETIDGSNTHTLSTQWDVAVLYSTGTEWLLL